MKNKLLKFLALAFTCVSLSAFVACGGGDLGNGSSSSSETSSAVEGKGLTFKTLSVDGLNVYGKVSNATTTFSFVNEIELSGNTTFAVAKDEFGSQTYLTQTVPLQFGDNVYYVFEMNGTQVVNTYTITLYRNHIYSVTFDMQGGTEIPLQQVEEDGFATMPEITPEREHYTFAGWDYDFSTPITSDTTVTAQWKINQYTLTIVYGNGTENKVIKQDYNSAISTVANPEKVGYTFTGWDKAIPATMPAEDVTITALWKAVFTRNGEEITGLTTHGKTLSDIVIPAEMDDVTITSIGSSAFRDCTNLTSVVIGNGVTSIGGWAFKECYNLTSVVIGNGVTSIGEDAFEDCDNLTSVVIPNSVTSIGEDAFYSCDNLTSVEIPDSVTSIGDTAFFSCDNLTSVEIGSGVIGYSAFYDCDNLTSVEIGSGVTSIGYSAFSSCDNLTSVIIPNGVTIIEGYAFSGCDNLTSVVIGNSVTSIGKAAFHACFYLSSVYYAGTASEWDSIDIDSYNNGYLTDATRYYYVENEADVSTDGGKYWHYVNGVPTAW